MRYVKEFAVVLALLMLAGCAGKPVQESPVATDEGIPAGQIYLYGEIHGIAAIEEYEAGAVEGVLRTGGCGTCLWSSRTTRPSGSTCGWTRRTMRFWSSSTRIGRARSHPAPRRWILPHHQGAVPRDGVPRHRRGPPVRQHRGPLPRLSGGAGLADTEDYRLTLEAIQQGKTFAERGSDIYRENRMAENFIREFDALDGESVMGIYGAAHTDPDAMADSAGTVPPWPLSW